MYFFYTAITITILSLLYLFFHKKEIRTKPLEQIAEENIQ